MNKYLQKLQKLNISHNTFNEEKIVRIYNEIVNEIVENEYNSAHTKTINNNTYYNMYNDDNDNDCEYDERNSTFIYFNNNGGINLITFYTYDYNLSVLNKYFINTDSYYNYFHNDKNIKYDNIDIKKFWDKNITQLIPLDKPIRYLYVTFVEYFVLNYLIDIYYTIKSGHYYKEYNNFWTILKDINKLSSINEFDKKYIFKLARETINTHSFDILWASRIVYKEFDPKSTAKEFNEFWKEKIIPVHNKIKPSHKYVDKYFYEPAYDNFIKEGFNEVNIVKFINNNMIFDYYKLHILNKIKYSKKIKSLLGIGDC